MTARPDHRRDAREAGATLIEMLVAALITCVLLGVLLQLAVIAQHSTRTQMDVADLQQRLRVAIDRINSDLVMAGAGPSGGAWNQGLVNAVAPLVPGRTGSSGADAELSYHADRLSILYVPDPSLQTAISIDMGAAGAPVVIDPTAPGCVPSGDCGFSPGDRALVFDPSEPEGSYDIFTVSATVGGQLLPASALSKAYAAGSLVMRVVQHVYHLDRVANRLMLYDGESSDLPLVDHVVDLRVSYFAEPSAASVPPPPAGRSNCAYASGEPPVPLLQDLGGTVLKVLTPGQLSDGPICGVAPHRFDADLLRVRRVRVILRLEAAAAELRGTGSRFVRSGTSSDGLRYVPDQQVVLDVAPRSLNLAR